MTPKIKCSDKKTKSLIQAEQKMLKILNKMKNLKLSDNSISQLTLLNSKGGDKSKKYYNKIIYFIVCGLLLFGAYSYWDHFDKSPCYIEMPASPKAIFRPPLSCDACSQVLGIERVSNITAQEFENKYAYSMQPVIVTDATRNWKALEEFSYNFFKRFYENNKMGTQINDCFFFRYKSGFDSLSEVFKMAESRANLSGQPWYVGWSTCYDQESRNLREYYNRPYFLPVSAESDVVDWIFMGGPGQGAHMHVDSVRHTSWQAQIRGTKQWELAPAPECLYSCRSFSFVIQPGEILVVDTNRWYHRTNVQPGDISITIGAEYD